MNKSVMTTLKYYRKKYNLTAKRFSQITGIPHNTITHYDSGVRPINMQLAHYLSFIFDQPITTFIGSKYIYPSYDDPSFRSKEPTTRRQLKADRFSKKITQFLIRK